MFHMIFGKNEVKEIVDLDENPLENTAVKPGYQRLLGEEEPNLDSQKLVQVDTLPGRFDETRGFLRMSKQIYPNKGVHEDRLRGLIQEASHQKVPLSNDEKKVINAYNNLAIEFNKMAKNTGFSKVDGHWVIEKGKEKEFKKNMIECFKLYKEYRAAYSKVRMGNDSIKPFPNDKVRVEDQPLHKKM